jgi:glycosyltransferase involved in cell wall biosynthesis
VVYLAHYIPDLIIPKWTSKKNIIGIYTDGYPPRNANFNGTIDDFYNQKLKKYDAIVVGANSIKTIYETVSSNVYFANMAYDQNFFNRLSPKIENNKREFIIGWTGQASRDFKGYYTHIVPAIEIVQKKYPHIKLKSRFSGPIETLPRFYDDVDLVVIASDADAGPFLFCEASLMSIPCISTKIGMVQDVLVHNLNGIYIDKNIDEIVSKIIHLYEHRELLHSMSRRIRNDFIGALGTTAMTAKWAELFNHVLELDER